MGDKEIIGYKYFDENLRSPFYGFQYEIGKTYEMEDTPKVGHVGFHFYNNLKTTFRSVAYYYSCEKICKVRALGDVDKACSMYCTNKIEILDEVDVKTKESLLNSLVDDINWRVRALVAKQGFGLDKLINDEDPDVRIAVAMQGYGLDKLINDENPDVRIAVAMQGFGLYKLINDGDRDVQVQALLTILDHQDLAQDIQQLVKNYFNKAED